jgi:hypothetical protein
VIVGVKVGLGVTVGVEVGKGVGVIVGASAVWVAKIFSLTSSQLLRITVQLIRNVDANAG